MTAAAAALAAALWAGRLWRLQRSVRRYAEFWRGPHGQDGGLLYVAVGDSVAQGIGASRPDRGYVGLLAARLARMTGRPVRVVNLSVSGARVADVVRDQLPALALYPRADLVTVAVGGNDLRRYRAEEYAVALAELVGTLPVGPTAVADIPYFMHGHFERDAAAAAGLLTALARGHGLVVAGLHEQMRAGGWAAMFSSYAADWFHPNDRGHQVWERAFWLAIMADPALSARLGLPET